MWIRNTSSYPDDEVKDLVRFACEGMPMTRVCVNVKGGRWMGGTAYESIPSFSNAPPSAEYLVTIRLPKVVEKVSWNSQRRGRRWPVYATHDWQELLVVIASHEAKHVEQFRDGRPRSEVACEHWARHRLSKYRVKRMQDAA